MTIQEWHKDEYRISTDMSLLDVAEIHDYLSNHSYWANGIPLSVLQKSIQHSICFGLFINDEFSKSIKQIGFARVVSDHATFAYLGDVYVRAHYRGIGLSKWLMECVLAHPELQGLRRFCLATKDAQSLYSRYGFEVLKQPENWMEIKIADIYKKSENLS